MTGLLISVTSLHEAETAVRAGVDILDMKNPAEGALGQLPLATIAEIVSVTNKRCVTSATIGDLPMKPELLAGATEHLIETGVDIVKIGFFGHKYHEICADVISRAARGRVKLIAVLMADESPDLTVVPALKAAGFYGVMLDTSIKQKKTLLDHLNTQQLSEFCELARDHDLVIGLAGSLRESHIPILAELGADYLGFRGAVCANVNRNAELDEGRLLLIKDLLYKNNKSKCDALYVRYIT